jgi:hypothetical protein
LSAGPCVCYPLPFYRCCAQVPACLYSK